MCISQCKMLSQRTLSLHVRNFDSSAWGSQFKNEGDLKLDAASDGNESLGIELQSSSEEVEPDVKKGNSPEVRKERELNPLEQELKEFNKSILNRCDSVESEELEKKKVSSENSSEPPCQEEQVEQKLEQFMEPLHQEPELVEEVKEEEPRVSFLDFHDDLQDKDEEQDLQLLNDNGDKQHQQKVVAQQEEEVKNINFLEENEDPVDELVEKMPDVHINDSPKQD